jgi:hypothetical protein
MQYSSSFQLALQQLYPGLAPNPACLVRLIMNINARYVPEAGRDLMS